jgi:hypothetical protein
VCLNCGVAYEYDLRTMSRTGRLVRPADAPHEDLTETSD